LVSPDDIRVLGAKKVLREAASLNKADTLLLLVDEPHTPIAAYFISAAKQLGMENVVFVYFPKTLRPLRKIPSVITESIQKFGAIIYLIDRMPEDSQLVWTVFSDIARKSKVKYLTMHDPKPQYLEKGGIWADYEVVERKGAKVARLLQEARRVEIKSSAGTELSFAFEPNSKAMYRSPSSKYGHNIRDWGVIQIPEGEGGRKPRQETFTGKIVVDGAITGLGTPSRPITLTFEKGQNKSVEGDSNFLEAMVEYVHRQGTELNSLTEMTNVTEFSMGFNDWSAFDDNISYCEKVSGGIHLGFGVEWEMFDMILTAPTLTIFGPNGKGNDLIDNGRLSI
jgi:hypothetical protein